MLQSVTECYRILQSITENSRVLQNIKEYYRVFLAHLLGPISGLVSLDPLTSQPTEYDDSSSGMESLSGTSKIGSAAGSTPTSARLALRWSLKL